MFAWGRVKKTLNITTRSSGPAPRPNVPPWKINTVRFCMVSYHSHGIYALSLSVEFIEWVIGFFIAGYWKVSQWVQTRYRRNWRFQKVSFTFHWPRIHRKIVISEWTWSRLDLPNLGQTICHYNNIMHVKVIWIVHLFSSPASCLRPYCQHTGHGPCVLSLREGRHTERKHAHRLRRS